MKKLLVLLAVISLLSVISLEAQSTAQNTSYGIVGLTYNFTYFADSEAANDGVGIKAKIPMAAAFGMEFGLAEFSRSLNSYSIPGTMATNLTGAGEEEYTEVSMNVLYYFWFLKELQLKMGISYLKWVRGNLVVDPSLADCGTLYNMCRNCRKSQFSFNIGLDLDVSIVKEFYAMTGFEYKTLLSDSVAAYGGHIGLGYRF